MKFLLLFMIPLFLINKSISQKQNTKYYDFPTPTTKNLWIEYTNKATKFKIWSPTSQKVQLKLYNNGNAGNPIEIINLRKEKEGVWSKKVKGDLNGTYYTYQVMINGLWLDETPGIYAQAVGVNGKRAMVLDLTETNPTEWLKDKGPKLTSPNDAIIYELHIRDMTIHPQSGSTMPGKYLGLVEEGTIGSQNVVTGIDHLKELGITYVHLLPTFDHYAIDETKLDSAQFNWGYDPQNYNVPEGSFSSNPFKAEVRIKEFKQMVKTFHDNSIGVILDVVYNHTGRTENSNFNLENPDYYYRQWKNGSYSDAAACGNETASERSMMRKFILESVIYWAKEYHLDGFRFDLMGIHDIETMNLIAEKLKTVNPNILIYGEGWTAKDSPLPEKQRALKKYVHKMPFISAFSDDIRDGIKGSVFDDSSTGFVSGAKNKEESIKFGIVGAINHPQINYKNVNYSDSPWTTEPWQAISYVSCHDNHTLFDKLTISTKNVSDAEIIAMDKLANAIVMTSQGIPFLHAGAEMLRTKKGEHNSYNLSDNINQIDWNWKADNMAVFNYYKKLIALRKAHPAFRMLSAEEVRNNLKFNETENGVVSYTISNYANEDSWKNILVIFNANIKPLDYALIEDWKIAVLGDDFDFLGNKTVGEKITVPPISMAILFQK